MQHNDTLSFETGLDDIYINLVLERWIDIEGNGTFIYVCLYLKEYIVSWKGELQTGTVIVPRW